VIQEALRSHPFVAHGGARRAGDDRGAAAAAPFDAPLPEPPGDPAELAFAAGPLGDLRAFVARHAVRGGLGAHAAADLVLAADEVASNSVRHGGGRGTLRIWGDDGAVVCEIRDAGRLDDPLAGRHIPPLDGDSGRGLWLANQLRDLVQLRTLPGGTVVRLHMRRPAGARA
jgi:anti-sigma regulatory factor (Ser/Thr protein kinase)